MNSSFSLQLRDRRLLFKRPAIMGIINVTPDSFSDGGDNLNLKAALDTVERLIKEGADIIDVGGESSRPGSDPVNISEERRRVIPLIREIKKRFKIPVSVDTTKELIAEEAVNECGADIVNDISSLRFSENMAEVISKSGVPVVLMHMKGIPKSMQDKPFHADIMKELKDFFIERVEYALMKGISKEKIIIDPGIGFGKRIEDNTTIIKNLSGFCELGAPILVGLSRKSFLGAISGEKDPKSRESETITANLISVLNGASIIRVHDVGSCKKSLKILNELI